MARKTSTVRGNVISVDRIGTSVNGNPTYVITIDGPDAGGYRTSSDAGCAYAATNYRPSWRRRTVPVVLTLTEAGRVIGIDGD
jgi:hypothetical protein